MIYGTKRKPICFMRMIRIAVCILAMLIAALPAGKAKADETETSGTCGDNLYWSYSDGTLTITGSGPMDHFQYAYSSQGIICTIPWKEYRNEIVRVILPDGITRIGGCAFADCVNLREIELPEGIESIGERAFCGCQSLPSITVPDGVVTFGREVFMNCYQLKSAYLPDSVTDLGDMHVFTQCFQLESVTLPSGIKTIPNGAFYLCHQLQSIEIPDGVTTIEVTAFEGCSALQEIELPESVTRIESRAFSNCTALGTITIGGNISYVGRSIYDDSPFYGTRYWNTYVEEHGDGPVYLDYLLLGYEGTCPEETVVKDGTRVIAASAFRDCRSISRIVLPESLETINDLAFLRSSVEEIVLSEGIRTIGEYAFSGGSQLKQITIPSSVRSILHNAFLDDDALTDVYYNGTEQMFRERLENNIKQSGNWRILRGDGDCAVWHFLTDVSSVELDPSDVRFNGTTPYVIYDGSEKTPRVIARDAAGEIVAEDDYTVTYRNNTQPGTAFADVYWNGGDGTKTVMFKIYLPPAERTAVGNTADGIRIEWAPVEGAKGYVIYRRAWNTKSGGWTAFARWNNTTATEWTDTKVYAGTRYQYGVKAYAEDPMNNYDLGRVGPLKTTVRITTRTVRSVTPGTRSLTVAWTGSSLFTGYDVQVATDAAFTKGLKTVRIANPKTYRTTIRDLKAETDYYVRVRSYDVFEGMTYRGGWSEPVKGRTQ